MHLICSIYSLLSFFYIPLYVNFQILILTYFTLTLLFLLFTFLTLFLFEQDILSYLYYFLPWSSYFFSFSYFSNVFLYISSISSSYLYQLFMKYQLFTRVYSFLGFVFLLLFFLCLYWKMTNFITKILLFTQAFICLPVTKSNF